MAVDVKSGETDHPIEKPMQDSHGSREIHQGHAGEAARQSLKHDKDLNRSSPEDQPDMAGGKQPRKKEN